MSDFDPFAVGEPGDVVTVGETRYASAHHATLSEAQLILERLGVEPHKVENDWPRSRGVILDWLGEDWQRQFRPVAARITSSDMANCDAAVMGAILLIVEKVPHFFDLSGMIRDRTRHVAHSCEHLHAIKWGS